MVNSVAVTCSQKNSLTAGVEFNEWLDRMANSLHLMAVNKDKMVFYLVQFPIPRTMQTSLPCPSLTVSKMPRKLVWGQWTLLNMGTAPDILMSSYLCVGETPSSLINSLPRWHWKVKPFNILCQFNSHIIMMDSSRSGRLWSLTKNVSAHFIW